MEPEVVVTGVLLHADAVVVEPQNVRTTQRAVCCTAPVETVRAYEAPCIIIIKIRSPHVNCTVAHAVVVRMRHVGPG